MLYSLYQHMSVLLKLYDEVMYMESNKKYQNKLLHILNAHMFFVNKGTIFPLFKISVRN